MAKYKRILLKISGESRMGKQNFGIDPERLNEYAKQIRKTLLLVLIRKKKFTKWEFK